MTRAYIIGMGYWFYKNKSDVITRKSHLWIIPTRLEDEDIWERVRLGGVVVEQS